MAQSRDGLIRRGGHAGFVYMSLPWGFFQEEGTVAGALFGRVLRMIQYQLCPEDLCNGTMEQETQAGGDGNTSPRRCSPGARSLDNQAKKGVSFANGV